MKTVVYITKNKIWVGEQSLDWDGVSFDEVFGRIKKELKVSEVRVVLGNDVSFVTAVKAGDTFLTRENVLKMVKAWMPFEIDNECFDWKQVVLAHNEVWIQIVALEKGLLLSLSSAVKKHGIKVDLVTAIGILLGEKTVGREAPVIINWNDKESLSVLAVDGLVDLVVADISEADLVVYAKQKWGLAVNPEILTINESDFKLSESVSMEKTKGEDKLILNLPILKEVVAKEKEEVKEVTEMGVVEKEEPEKKKSSLWIYLLVLVITMITGGIVMYRAGIFKSIIPSKQKTVVVVTPTPSPTAIVTPEPVKVDLTTLQVQVLNGSGVTGEAAKIKSALLASGFVNVDTGNATATTEGTIKSKAEIATEVLTIVNGSVSDYKMGTPDVLTGSDKYDLIIVVGSAKKL